MLGADYLIVAVVGLSVIVGAVRGFVREAVALFTWLLAIWFAWRFSGFLHPYLGGLLQTPEQKAWVARGIVLVAVLLLGSVVAAVLSWVTHTAAGLGAIDRLFGIVFGLTRGVVLVGFGALLALTLRLDHQAWWRDSKLAPYAGHVAGWLETFAGESPMLRRALNGHGGDSDPGED